MSIGSIEMLSTGARKPTRTTMSSKKRRRSTCITFSLLLAMPLEDSNVTLIVIRVEYHPLSLFFPDPTDSDMKLTIHKYRLAALKAKLDEQRKHLTELEKHMSAFLPLAVLRHGGEPEPANNADYRIVTTWPESREERRTSWRETDNSSREFPRKSVHRIKTLNHTLPGATRSRLCGQQVIVYRR